MRHIDKTVYREHFNQYSEQYLNDSYNGDEFIPNLESLAAYENFSQRKYKYTPIPEGSRFNGWLDILMHEHEGRCCYCMRKMNESEVSVEHLVPESFEKLNETEELDFYRTHAPYLRSHLLTGREFNFLIAQNQTNPTHLGFPHLIAHANLFPACNCNKPGCSCNNHRGNKRILPLMLMEDVMDWTAYDEYGKFQLSHEDVEAAYATQQNLDLNTDTLIIIRRFWYLLSRLDITLDVLNDNSFVARDGWVRRALNLSENQVIPEEFRIFLSATNLYYWDLFLKYDWFYDYYKQKYPILP